MPEDVNVEWYLSFLIPSKLRKHSGNALALSIPYSTNAVACEGTKHEAGYVGHDEA